MAAIKPGLGWIIVVVLGAPILAAAGPTAGELPYSVRVSDRTLWVEASGAPLGRLLQAVAAAAGIEELQVDPAQAERPVTIALDGVGIREGFTQILLLAEGGFAIEGGEDPSTMRVFLMESQDAPDYLPEVGAAGSSGPDRYVGQIASVTDADGDPIEDEEPYVDREAEAAESAAQYQAALAQLQTALTPPATPPSGAIGLPFPGPNGQPIVQYRDPNQTIIGLPFPDENGNPIMVDTSKAVPAGPPPSDPAQRALIEALTPKPQNK